MSDSVDMAVTCKRCGGAHPLWECTKEPEAEDRASGHSGGRGLVSRGDRQHLERKRVAAGVEQAEPKKAEGPKDQIISKRDRAAYNAYQREYQRKRRAQIKADLEELAKLRRLREGE